VKKVSFKLETLLLFFSVSISILFVLYLTYYLNFTSSTSFLSVLKESFDFSKGKYPISLYFMLLWNSTIIVITCLSISFFLGFILSKYDFLSNFFSILAAIPELLLAVLFRVTMWNPVKNANNELAKGLIICIPIILRSTASMYKYFKLAREKYLQTYFYHLTMIRDMPNLKRWKYLMQSTFLDAMSNVIYEFPLLISYVAVLERIFEFRGLSRQFLNSMIYGNPYELFRFTILILTMLALFQTIFITIVRISDKREKGK